MRLRRTALALWLAAVATVGSGNAASAQPSPSTVPPASAGDWSAAQAEALRIASPWGLKPVEFVVGDRATVEATDGRQVLLGRSIAARIQAETPKAAPALLVFILLHELWHLKELETVGSLAHLPNTKRPAFECRADVEAARAFVLDELGRQTDWKDAAHRQAAFERISTFRTAWNILVADSPVSAGTHEHLTKRQRVLALQFGLYRAFAELLPQAAAVAPELTSIAGKLGGQVDLRDGTPREAWSREICDRIVGRNAEALASVDINFRPGDLDLDTHLQTVKFNVKNKDRKLRDIRVSVTALSGIIPDGSEGQFDKYLFSDAASASTTVAAGGSTTLELKLLFPIARKGAQSFLWRFPEDALLSAHFVTPPRSCVGDGVRSDRAGDPILHGLAKLGSDAPDGFASTKGPEEIVGGARTGFYKSLVQIEGARDVRIADVAGMTWAWVTLYEGESESESRKIFEAAVSSVERACPDKAIAKRRTSRDGQSAFEIDLFTPDASAQLLFEMRKPTAETSGKATYTVSWSIRRR